MELCSNNVDAFIKSCIHNARYGIQEPENDPSDIESDISQQSLHMYYIENLDEQIRNISLEESQEAYSTKTPSLSTDSEESTLPDHISELNADELSYKSLCGSTEASHNSSESLSQRHPLHTGDDIPKSFLQLKGIMVGNYNMGCNFHILAALRIMIQHNLGILAIQEHTAWNRSLTEHEITSIEKHCDKWGYFVTISKLQIVITDKPLLACHCETTVEKEGRIIVSRFQVSTKHFVNFISMYGIPHSGKGRLHPENVNIEENSILQEMNSIKQCIIYLVKEASKAGDIVFVFGDLQDTPDNSKKFHYGRTRLPKHPLGIVSACEELGLTCSIYQHIDNLEKPVISRQGLKGGRFIDGMYTCTQGLEKILGIHIIKDTGVFSDHLLVVSKIDLGIEKFDVCNEREERIDFRRLMNIPMHIKKGDIHHTLNTNIYKGEDFRMHAKLYDNIQETVHDGSKHFLERITNISTTLKNLEKDVILRTISNINREDQASGKLSQRSVQDATILNDASSQFFTLVHDICREVGLAKMVRKIPSTSSKGMQQKVSSEKIIPGISSIAITKQIDDLTKRARSITQRSNLLLRTIVRSRIINPYKRARVRHTTSWNNIVLIHIQRFQNQQEMFVESMIKTGNICTRIKEEREDHIKAIESARNKKFYGKDVQFVDEVINEIGREEYVCFINDMKREILGACNTVDIDSNGLEKKSKIQLLQLRCSKWQKLVEKLNSDYTPQPSSSTLRHWYFLVKRLRVQSKKILFLAQQVRKEEWDNSKNYLIQIGKYGQLARMVNPKPRSGPVASRFYPTAPNAPRRRALNDYERKEASILTHELWMDNPPGRKNCHFLDIIQDDVGPCGVNISCDKEFGAEAEWLYLEGMLAEKVNDDIIEKIRYAHQKLPILFKQIKADNRIVYPFKYDCITGEFLYPNLEHQLRKNCTCGNGKARATGFAIPVLGRLPKIFIDAYIIKCRVQMTLRLLDTGTECSMRICIGKPCGGVRPLTVSHDDNVFLNGLAQQAIQQEISRLSILPQNIFSYQKGKGCADATIIDNIVKEIALQKNDHFLAELSDDAEKMFDRLYMEIQIALLMLAGAGIQGFTEWQSANMVNRTNKLVTDIFIALMQYKCGLPQGNGFSVEIANLYAMLLLMWWNMDPINPCGVIAPFTKPPHGFPLIAGGILLPISSMAYVDDAKRFIAMPKQNHTCAEFFRVVQGYCDLLADLSLVIKMGRNVKKCTIYLYNIPEHMLIPEFSSTAWSFEAQGPVKGTIEVVTMFRDDGNNLICYDVEKSLLKNMPQNIKSMLADRKYLGVPTNAQMESTTGKQKIINKMQQRITIISKNASSVQEARILHNMLVCQVATFSPLCISMTLKECEAIDKFILQAYQYRLKYMPSDAKHSIFISQKKGGIEVRSFTREYIGALLRDIEVYISNENSITTHALLASIEAAHNQQLWKLYRAERLPPGTDAALRATHLCISSKKILHYHENIETPNYETSSYDHIHTMENAIRSSCQLGFILRDLTHEFCARFTDELLLADRNAKAIASRQITTRATLGACLREGNAHFFKYSLLGHVYILLNVILEEAKKHVLIIEDGHRDTRFEDILTRPVFYHQLNCFPKEISAVRLANTAKRCFSKYRHDYEIGSFKNMMEWRCCLTDLDHDQLQEVKICDFRKIVDETNVFRPSALQSMQTNCEHLITHLKNILSLAQGNETIDIFREEQEGIRLIRNDEIIDFATQHDLPIFISIDGSVQDEVATVSVSIIAPHILTTDIAHEWQNRPAKVLLIRSWRLPQIWGTGHSCINMVEAFGFIIGEYTIPSDLPIIYITDSNNARTLQRNLKNKESFTHRQLVRRVQQGIDQAIANHLDLLTTKWPSRETLSNYALEMYKKGEEICNIWMNQPCGNTSYNQVCDTSVSSSLTLNDDSSCSESSCNSDSIIHKTSSNNRNKIFDSSMCDFLDRIIIIKVSSHQVTADFTVENIRRQPCPNLFVVSANQIADNAVTLAQNMFKDWEWKDLNHCVYPPFSPKWCFSFEGSLVNKGATKVLYEKIDNELIQ
jgi:hypothetical protein